MVAPRRAYQMFINNEWVDSASGRMLASVNPATGEVWAEVPEGDSEDVDRAVAAARKAFEEGPWRKMAPIERGKRVRRLGELITENAAELARLETLDNGKAIRETLGVELAAIPNWYHYFGGLADKIQGETVPLGPDFLNYTVREPVGVVGAITPWNSPLLMYAMKLGPALAAGNTLVLKPAEQTPVTALELAKLIQRAEFPPGVVNVVPGYGEGAGAALVRHPGVDKIAFTGETTTGQAICREMTGNLKRLTCELGGKSPNIVFDDAEMENALRGAMAGVFVAAGQTCVAGSRLLLHERIADEFVARLLERVQRIRVGDPLDPQTHIGSLVSREQQRKVEDYVRIGKEEGAELLCGGPPRGEAFARGCFFLPTVFARVRNSMRIAQEEIFGPVVCVLTFREEEEAVELANDVKYGLAAGVWTGNVKRAHRIAGRIRAGTVWVNNYRRIHFASPFGGYKLSGFGRENGLEVIREYTQVKSVWVDLGAEIPDPFPA